METTTGATPLIALAAAAVDTETTGPDAGRARIIQIGAVGIERGKVVPGDRLDLLVDPGEPIPPASTRIHGISDSDVRSAASFAAEWPTLQRFVGSRILVGHTIGFDLAVLERECRRAGLAWEKPRSLCVRLLATVAHPQLADHSLDMIADWLGVRVEGRHTGLGDAIAAGEIFVALLPELRKQGIRTLGEAENACLMLSHALEAGHRAGWVEPVARPRAPAFQPVDPYAYRHRVDTLMSHPPVVVAASEPAGRVIDLMVTRKISSVLVSERGVPGEPVEAYGIVTERDMLRQISNEREEALAAPVGAIASRPLASVRAAAFAYRAIGRMDRLGLRHLAVRSDDGRLVGMLSARDLLRLRAGSAIKLDDAIEDAPDAAALAAAWATLPGVARSLLGEDIDARSVASIVSEELCALTRRAAVLAEQAMQAAGEGPPPSPYAVLVLGSGGRGESLLAPDQDNAVIFAEGDPDGPEDRWFAAFGELLAAMLDAAGVPFCRGGVMAKNPGFRGSLESWKARVDQWVRRSRPEDLLNVDIVFDLRPVHGDLALGAGFLDYAYERGHAEPAFAKLLGEQIVAGTPFTMFGSLQLEEGRFDIKKHGLFPIVAAARTLAIRNDVRAAGTRDRLEGLMARGIGGERDMKAMAEGHDLLLRLALAQQTRDIYAGIAVSNRVELAALSREQQKDLKQLVRRLQAVPDLLHDLMFR
ncbi:DUF294 nucleotidyltransferase-like domain-containing protein [Aurantimonas endophytica]|uniref:DNA polymerase-3 subunit epsilon/CBS domain-containing protein n=1 Tax=Aurantimonas endophytica TaxID=1522175 RepID=A0A7W6HG36_9HYPH|nr:DUF294 nucleotidyltransferase-like domain-containing protein [Aurantimonas endophytica]MBB4004526.1 DNA polymerase-3 subunit epsilon/CBS domain-containing protein [Aurantimonas endophytica]MCO6405362.1 CBS domain-containing protein [Aurantimonas endophytica]